MKIKIKEVFSLAYTDGKSRRKNSRLLYGLVTFTLVLYLVVNTLAGSLAAGVTDIVEKPYGRVFSILTDAANYKQEMKDVKEKYANSPEIGEIAWHIYSRSAIWKESDLVGESPHPVLLGTSLDALEPYLKEGKLPGKGEVIVPEYLYDLGVYDQYSCADGSELMGQEITFEVENTHEMGMREYTFQVVGVYDNVRSGGSNDFFCINEQDALEIDDFYGCYGQEDHIRRQMEEYNLPEEEYDRMLWNHAIQFYVNPGYDVEEVMTKISGELGKNTSLFVTPVGSIVGFYQFVIYLGDAMAVLLGITAVIVLVVTILRELRNRRGQFALRYACGYTKSMQMCAYLLENTWILLKACLTGLAIVVVVMLAGQYIILHIVPFYMRDVRLFIPWSVMGVSLVSVILGGVLCLIVSIPGILKIKAAETLKKEGGR